MRLSLAVTLCTLASLCPARSDPPTPSFYGPSGAILTPSAVTLGGGRYALSLRYREHRNHIAVSYSPRGSVEVGATVADPSRPGAEPTEFGLNLKYMLLRESEWAPAIAVGVGLWDVARGEDDGQYVVGLKRIGLPWPKQPVKLAVGGGRGVFGNLFASLSVPVHPWATALAEFDGSHPNLVARVTLPRGFCVDVGSLNWTLGVGATYGAEW
ncbi:MAG: YjbH domain-containing protein [Armatimonadetes bacterium]|nr:YjbH domain-containing protein [Armatimonadota bacterium]